MDAQLKAALLLYCPTTCSVKTPVTDGNANGSYYFNVSSNEFSSKACALSPCCYTVGNQIPYYIHPPHSANFLKINEKQRQKAL